MGFCLFNAVAIAALHRRAACASFRPNLHDAHEREHIVNMLLLKPSAAERWTMPLSRFHCIDGAECVLDTVDANVRAPERSAAHAAQIAREVMRSLSDRSDGSQCRVTVHDLTGRRVLRQRFVTHGADPSVTAA